MRYEVAARRGLPRHHPPRRDRGGPRRGAQRARGARRPRAGARVLLPLQVRPRWSARTGARAPRPRRSAGSRARVRLRVVPELPRRLLHAYEEVANSADIHAVVHLGDYIYEGRRRPSASTSRCARSSRSTTTGSATASTRPTSTCRRRTRRSRGSSPGTTTSSRTTTPTWTSIPTCRSRWRPHAARPPTGPTGSTCRCAASRKPGDRPSSSTAASTGAISSPSTCSTGASTAPTSRPRARPRSGRRAATAPAALEPGRTMLGAEQRDWLLEELATTTARWNVLANQTAFAPFDNDSERHSPRLRGGRQLGRLRRRAAAAARLDGRQAHAEPDRDHRRLAQQLGAQRAAGPHQLRRAARGHGVHGHVDLHGRGRGRVHPGPRRRRTRTS